MNNEQTPSPDDLVYLAGGDVDQGNLSLCLYDDDLNPTSLSELLGLEPTRSHRKGETHGVDNSGIWKTGAWIHKVTALAPTTPQELASDLLESLPDRDKLWQDLTAKYRVVVWFGLYMETYNRDFKIENAVLTRLAAIGADVVFDMYYDERVKEQ